MTRIIDQPRTQLLNGVSFTDAEVIALASWFQAGIPASLDKSDIVASSEIQKGLKAAAVYSSDIDSGTHARLYVTADGYELMGLHDGGATPTQPEEVTFSDEEKLELRAFFPTVDMITLTPLEVRNSPLLVKAVVAQKLHVGAAGSGPDPQVVLRLTQKGRALLGER